MRSVPNAPELAVRREGEEARRVARRPRLIAAARRTPNVPGHGPRLRRPAQRVGDSGLVEIRGMGKGGLYAVVTNITAIREGTPSTSASVVGGLPTVAIETIAIHLP